MNEKHGVYIHANPNVISAIIEPVNNTQIGVIYGTKPRLTEPGIEFDYTRSQNNVKRVFIPWHEVRYVDQQVTGA